MWLMRRSPSTRKRARHKPFTLEEGHKSAYFVPEAGDRRHELFERGERRPPGLEKPVEARIASIAGFRAVDRGSHHGHLRCRDTGRQGNRGAPEGFWGEVVLGSVGEKVLTSPDMLNSWIEVMRIG